MDENYSDLEILEHFQKWLENFNILVENVISEIYLEILENQKGKNHV